MERLVMIPGPTPVVRSIQDQMGRPIQAFGDPEFVADYKGVIDDLRTLFGCDGTCFVINGSGTLAMEMAAANVTKPNDAVLILSNGYFGDRYAEICKRRNLDVDVLQSIWGQSVDLNLVKDALKNKRYTAVLATHVDTSTGVCLPLPALGKIMNDFPETLLIVDGVCATAAIPEDMREMNINILLTCTQKAFGVAPGLAMVWADQKALQARENLGTIPDYYIDFKQWIPVMDNPARYFSTPSVNLVWAVSESVRIIQEEGLSHRYDRHVRNARAVQKALEALGFKILAEPEVRAATLSNAIYPEGIDDAKFRAKLYEEGIVVAGGLAAYAGKMFRLGHMGNVTTHELAAALSAIEKALDSFGKLPKYGTGVGTFLEALKQ